VIKQTLILILALTSFFTSASTDYGQLANKYHKELVDSKQGIGAREAGTQAEVSTADYIKKQLIQMGYKVEQQSFTFGKEKLTSQNLIVNTNSDIKQTIVLGAHYDSTAQKKGSLGATDNGAGVSALLAIAQGMKAQKKLTYNIRFIAFGAEEVGLEGSKAYMKDLQKNAENVSNIIAMINFDTIAGGDYTYVHSAHTTPYKCATNAETFNSETIVRDALLSASNHTLGAKNKYVIHPNYPGYPEGVTGSWSDHAPFACAGIPIAYVESTNFTINGEDGFDGYSQTTNPSFWDCYNESEKTACDRKKETKWGKIWHTQFDRIDTLNKHFPDRVERQISNNVKVIIDLLSNTNQYFNKS